MNKNGLCIRLLLLPLALLSLVAGLVVSASAASPMQTPTPLFALNDKGIITALIILIAILFACVILLISLTQWVRVRFRQRRDRVIALENEIHRVRSGAVFPDKKDEETPATAETEAKVDPAPTAEEPIPEETIAEESVAEEPVDAEPQTSPTEEERTAAIANAFSALAGGQGDEMSATLVTSEGRHVVIKLRQSYRARMIQADEESKACYSEIKNYLLSFDGVTPSDSQNYESFAAGRRQLAKINITGKTLVLYLALDPAKLDGSKYKFENVGDRKRFEKTPVKIKVRSARSFKWAKELVDMAMAEDGRAPGEVQAVNYAPACESKASLIAHGLIQVTAQEVESGMKLDTEAVVGLIEAGAHWA